MRESQVKSLFNFHGQQSYYIGRVAPYLSICGCDSQLLHCTTTTTKNHWEVAKWCWLTRAIPSITMSLMSQSASLSTGSSHPNKLRSTRWCWQQQEMCSRPSNLASAGYTCINLLNEQFFPVSRTLAASMETSTRCKSNELASSLCPHS